MLGVDMKHYSAAAVERTMKIQEVILRALAKKINWWQAADIIGISDRQVRRWKRRYEEYGYDGLYDRRKGKPTPRRVPVETAERVLGLYREKYFDPGRTKNETGHFNFSRTLIDFRLTISCGLM